MKTIKQYEHIQLKDGREGVVVEVIGNQDIFLVDVGSSPKDWENITVAREEILD